MGQKVLQSRPPLLDHLRVIIRLMPEVSFGEGRKVELHTRRLTPQSLSSSQIFLISLKRYLLMQVSQFVRSFRWISQKTTFSQIKYAGILSEQNLSARLKSKSPKLSFLRQVIINILSQTSVPVIQNDHQSHQQTYFSQLQKLLSFHLFRSSSFLHFTLELIQLIEIVLLWFVLIIINYMMANNFKNPFELEQQDTMITLEPIAQKSMQSYNPTFSLSSPPDSNNSFFSQDLGDHGKSMFNPLNENLEQSSSAADSEEQPPLLEDIGINIDLIIKKIKAVFTFQEIGNDLVDFPDLSGPILISLCLGFLLLLGGKIHFSDILTYFILGNVVLYVLFMFMGKGVDITFYSTMSFLGYGLLPMLLLAIFGILLPLNNLFGILSSLILSGWSSFSAGSVISLALNRQEGKILIVYPLFLFYLSFALIIIY